jgi:hypothetical protein
MLVTMKVSARELKDSRIVPELAPPRRTDRNPSDALCD